MKLYTTLMVSTGMFFAGALPAHAQFGDLLKKAQSAIEEAVEEVIPIEESNSSTEENVPSGENSVASTEEKFESEEKLVANSTEKAVAYDMSHVNRKTNCYQEYPLSEEGRDACSDAKDRAREEYKAAQAPQLAEVGPDSSCGDFASHYGWNSYEFEQCGVLKQQAAEERKAKILAMDIDETTDCFGPPFNEMGEWAYGDCQYAQTLYKNAESERRREEYALQKEQEEQERLEREQQEQLAKAEREQARQQYIASLRVIGQEDIEDALSSRVDGRLREDNGISWELGFVADFKGVRPDADYKFKGDMSCFDEWDDRVGKRTEVQGSVIFDPSGQMDFSFNLSAEPKAGTWLYVSVNQLEMGMQSTDIREVAGCQFDDLRIKKA